jgi:hypothetical protein
MRAHIINEISQRCDFLRDTIMYFPSESLAFLCCGECSDLVEQLGGLKAGSVGISDELHVLDFRVLPWLTTPLNRYQTHHVVAQAHR